MAEALFTCITCRVAFTDAEIQRSHYKTDWHRYNLKRKVAEMPPVTAENFQQRVLSQKEKASTEGVSTSSHCLLCNKHFASLNAYNNHLQSKKHKELEARKQDALKVEEKNKINKDLNKKAIQKDAVNEALKGSVEVGASGDLSALSSQAGSSQSGKTSQVIVAQEEDMDDDDSDTESWESFDGEGLGIEECLFCSQISQSLESNLKHMTDKHSFFIPDAEYVSDLEGLVSYLGQKVGEGNLCLWCNEHGRRFQSTQAAQRHMMDKGHCKILHEGESLFEYADFYDYRSSYPDYDSEAPAEGASGGEMEVVVADTDIEESPLESDGYELVLPSGVTVGHRSLQRYFKQNISAHRHNQTRSIIPRLLAQYKALGWTGLKGEAAVQKAKDMSVFHRLKDKHRMRLGVKANKLQPHFRCQIMF